MRFLLGAPKKVERPRRGRPPKVKPSQPVSQRTLTAAYIMSRPELIKRRVAIRFEGLKGKTFTKLVDNNGIVVPFLPKKV